MNATSWGLARTSRRSNSDSTILIKCTSSHLSLSKCCIPLQFGVVSPARVGVGALVNKLLQGLSNGSGVKTLLRWIPQQRPLRGSSKVDACRRAMPARALCSSPPRLSCLSQPIFFLNKCHPRSNGPKESVEYGRVQVGQFLGNSFVKVLECAPSTSFRNFPRQLGPRRLSSSSSCLFSDAKLARSDYALVWEVPSLQRQPRQSGPR